MVSGVGSTARTVGESRPPAKPVQTWFSTESVSPGRRVTDWESHHATTLVGLRAHLVEGTGLRARTATLQLPRIRIAKVSGSPHSVRRSAEDVALHPISGAVIYLPVERSHAFSHHAGSIMIGPGRGLVCDGDTTFSRDFTQGVSELVVHLPQEILCQITGTGSVRRPTPLDLAYDGRAHTATRELMQLANGALDRVLRQGEKLESRLLDLLTAALDEPLTSRDDLQEALEVISQAHCDPGLGASLLSQTIGVSERQLSRLFSAAGHSIPRAILDARLTSARRMLADRARAQTPMAEIAFDTGFRSQAQLSRSYRSRFGISCLRHRRQLLEEMD